jgi:cytochrome c-type biogenesis protein
MPDLTLATAFVAGVISFLSPCVLPVVPAYLGQLGVITVAGVPAGTTDLLGTRRWRALRAALAFVLGFGAIFTLLGLTVYVGGSIGVSLPLLRQAGGLILIVLGLNMMGVLHLSTLARSWRPLDRAAARRSGSGLAASPVGAFGLGAIFAIGWTPCIGPTLGAILGLASLGPSAQAVALFVFYSLGLAIPFLALALTLDRAPALVRPLLRHSRTVEIVGGGLIVMIGAAMVFDWLFVLAATFSWLWPRV